MRSKLARRNVRRQLGNYCVYFLTVAITVALMYAVNNVIYNPQLQAYASDMEELNSVLTVLSVFVALVVAFVLGYATSYMLRLRRREFGTYFILGMTRRNVLAVFLTETLLLFACALGLGLVFGLGFYQGAMALLQKLVGMELQVSAYTLPGLVLTVALVGIMFLLSSLASARYLKKASIAQLLSPAKAAKTDRKHPGWWLALAALSLAAILLSCFRLSATFERLVYVGVEAEQTLMAWLAVLLAGVFGFHLGVCLGLPVLLLKAKALRCRGANTFVLRGLTARLGSNAVTISILALLVTISIVGANISFTQRIGNDAMLAADYPFDLQRQDSVQEASPLSFEAALDIIEDYASLTWHREFPLYTSGRDDLHQYTPWHGEGYSELTDSYLKLSDYNALRTALGKPTVALEDGFLLVAGVSELQGCDFSGAAVTLNAKTYPCQGVELDEQALISQVFFTAVVPDKAVAGMTEQANCQAVQLAVTDYDAAALRQALSVQQTMNIAFDGDGQAYYASTAGEEVTFTDGDAGADTPSQSFTMELCPYSIREYARILTNTNSAIFVLGALYVSMVFVLMAMAILALKTLSGLAEDQVNYRILYQLGADGKTRCQALYRQNSAFFLLPFALPLVMSIPVGFLCAKVMQLVGYADAAVAVALSALGIALAVAIIYLLFFAATYLIAKRNLITGDELT